jgi:hypothetical protein
MADLPGALVLSWDACTVKIRCPFQCDRGVHVHGCTMPGPHYSNTRAAHCNPSKRRNIPHAYSSYRLVFPFEDDPLTVGLWWELNDRRNSWRTVGWGIEDPDDDQKEDTVTEPEVDGNEEDGSSDDDFAGAFAEMQINDPKNPDSKSRSVWKSWFDSHCLCKEIEMAKEIYEAAENPQILVDDPNSREPILLMTCEEGHIEVVEWLLSLNPDLEATDPSGDTALVKAATSGCGRIVVMLMNAGANTEVTDSHRTAFLDICKEALEKQLNIRDCDANTLL